MKSGLYRVPEHRICITKPGSTTLFPSRCSPMTVISGKGKSKAIGKKLSPSGGLVIFWKPGRRGYPMTPQQRLFQEIARKCGAVKGVTKQELREKVFPCIRAEWDKRMGRSTVDLDREIRLAKEAR